MGKSQHFIPFFLSIILMGMIIPNVYAQGSREATEAYIRRYKDIAIKDMKKYKIPASITLAQGILESGSGMSRIARKGNNHFGIKCHNDWHGKKILMTDDARHECFRKYDKPEDSYRDHSIFLTQRGRYSFLFHYPITDYVKWAYGLKRAGYATNPKYPQLLINIIRKYHLYRYDQSGHKKHKKKKKTRRKSKVYSVPQPSSFVSVGHSQSGRMVYLNNNCRLIRVQSGDTYKKIADEFEITPGRFMRFNDSKEHQTLFPGDILYLEHKRNKAEKGYRFHVVKQGESLWGIAQLYGIKLSRLRLINNLPQRVQSSAGVRLRVR